MTTLGQLTAKPPASPHANLTAVERIGTTKCGSAIWRVECTCGATFTADAPAIKRGGKHAGICKTCNRAEHEKAVLVAMPGTYGTIARKTKLPYSTVTYWVDAVRGKRCFVGGWERAEAQGSFNPVFHAGEGEDAPCMLKARSRANCERRYEKRIKRAIKKAMEGGKEDPRYIRHIALHKAKQTAKQARKEPQTWASALFAVAKKEGSHA